MSTKITTTKNVFIIIISDIAQETDCTSRSLATLLVAWVGAAMVASILLRWKYMWIVLLVLTLLFLIVCGYAAYTTKKAQDRAIAAEQEVRRQRAEMEIQTISGDLGNFTQVVREQLFIIIV